MSNFKRISTTVVYRNSLLAPKGYRFNLDAIKSSGDFEEDLLNVSTKCGDRILTWEEKHCNLYGSEDASFWEQIFTVENGYLVEEE